MRLNIGWLVTVVFASIPAIAKDGIPASLQDKGQHAVQAVRNFSVGSPEGTGLNYSVTCHAKLIDPFFGYLSDDKYFAEKFPVNLICYHDDGIVQRGWARFDAASQTWQPNLDPEEKAQLKGAFHFYPLQAANKSGWAVTVDDMTGDENGRRRTLHYCLLNPPKALCGNGDVGYLKDGRKGDLTEYALRILRSIEFLPDDPTTADGQAAPAAPESSAAK